MVTLASDDLGVWTLHSWYLKKHGERVIIRNLLSKTQALLR